MIKRRKKEERGFSIVEALIAIAILVVSVSAPLTLAAKGLNSAFFARDQVTAFYLAQEAVEIIRNKRDENVLSGIHWLSGFPSTAGALFTVDTTDNGMEQCTGACQNLRYDDATGFYNYNTGQTSRFSRSVTLTDINGNEAAVSVTVTWQSGIFTRSFSVRENILNWQ